ATTDREQHRSSAPNDLRGPHRQDETRRTVDLGHSSNGPSWIDLAENRVNTTESSFEASLNRLLQQNPPLADFCRSSGHCPPLIQKPTNQVVRQGRSAV